MNKQDIIEDMAAKADISKSAAERAFNAFTELVTDTLCKRENVVIPNFGTFSTSDRAARTGRNPSTGEPMHIPASVVARFKAGKKLKDAVNHSDEN